jgi:hypothetical protein
MESEFREYAQSHGVQRDIVDLLFSVYPGDSFSEYFSIFAKALNQPSNLKDLIENLRVQLNMSVTSHIMIAARGLLFAKNFSMFTRDYVRRCCDLVEYITKFLLAPQLGVNVGRKPLGGIIKALKKSKYADLIPKDLIHNLDSFNKIIYCPAKHEVSENEEKHKYNIVDAVAITFISMKLSKQLYDLRNTLSSTRLHLK